MGKAKQSSEFPPFCQERNCATDGRSTVLTALSLSMGLSARAAHLSANKARPDKPAVAHIGTPQGVPYRRVVLYQNTRDDRSEGSVIRLIARRSSGYRSTLTVS